MLRFRRCLTCFTGIGNPEPRYAGTRHNVGLIFLDLLKNRLDPKQLHPYKTSSTAPVRYSQPTLELVMIRSDGNYMNLSGNTVVPIWNKLPHRNHVTHVVVHDELSLPLGKVQLRKPGTSLRGHNGLKSIQNCWGNNNFYKLSVGIGRPLRRDSDAVSDYVLSKFGKEEMEVLQTTSLLNAWEKIRHLVNSN